jgi:hypothetical protein
MGPGLLSRNSTSLPNATMCRSARQTELCKIAKWLKFGGNELLTKYKITCIKSNLKGYGTVFITHNITQYFSSEG